MPTALTLFEQSGLTRRWVEPPSVDAVQVERIGATMRLPLPLCRLLVQRGYADPEAARAFLRPRREHMHAARLLAGMDAAVDRVASAIRAGEVILVHGDYDVDGVCGTALLTRALAMMGGRPVPFVPHRVENGYDLGSAGIAAARDAGASLIVTTDCGIVAHDAVRQARAVGIDVVVTDHHTPAGTLPDAAAVLNPNRTDCGYPEKGLAGAAVAFKLALAVADAVGFPEDRIGSLVDLVAIATIADLAPLTSENRAIVKWGLSILARTPNRGLRALLSSAGLGGSEITAGQVGYVLAPRINAVGRVGSAMAAVRLLLTEDTGEADRLAQLHETENRRRRDLDEATFSEALEKLEREFDPARDFAVVLASETWHPGVIGIVASRVVERIHRPAVLVAVGPDEAKGSGRSIRNFHLQQAFVACAEHLDRFGGHRAAAGCSLQPGRIGAFREALNERARQILGQDDLVPELRLDARLELGQASHDLLGLLKHFGPFGIGNPTPLFASYGVVLDGLRIVGNGHLKATLKGDDGRLEAIGFGMGDRAPEVSGGRERFDVAYRLEENEWTGGDGRVRRTLQARLVDFRPAA